MMKRDLEQLIEKVRLGAGGVRVSAQFDDGDLVDARVHAFRLPASRLDDIHTRRQLAHLDDDILDRDLLEQLARRLGLERGRTELVAEYVDHGDGPSLHWLDFNYPALPEPVSS